MYNITNIHIMIYIIIIIIRNSLTNVYLLIINIHDYSITRVERNLRILMGSVYAKPE